jgi:aminopeptidase N
MESFLSCRAYVIGAFDKVFAEESAPEHFPRDRTFHLRHVRLDIALDLEKGEVRGTATLLLSPLNDGLREIDLDGEDLHIRKVTDQEGRSLEFDYDGKKLRVRLGRAYKADTDFTLKIAYDARPRKGMFFVRPTKPYPKRPWMVWTQGEQEDNRAWFPSYDAPNQRMTSEVVVTVPERQVAISNGRLLKEKHHAARKTRTYHWLQDLPHVNYLITVVSGEFDRQEEMWDGVPLQCYVPKGEGPKIKDTFKHIPSMMTFFSKATGQKYPWAKYAQAVVRDFTFGGMENTTLVVLIDNCLVDEYTRPDYRPEGLFAHELAHQWFGDFLTTKSWNDLWLNEGFASYFDPLWFESEFGRDEFHWVMHEEANGYFEEDAKSYRRPIVTSKYHDNEDMLDAHTYNKAACVLHMMRFVLGEDLWWKAIRFYVKRHALGNVETNDLKEAIADATGRNLDKFFDQWYYKAGHPEFEVSWKYDDKTKLVALTVKQKQEVKDLTPLFTTPVEIELHAKDKARRERIEVSRPDQVFFLESAAKPDALLFDPDNWILKKLTFEKPKEELLFQLKKSDRIIPRMQACEGLSKILKNADVVEALQRALTKDPYFAVKRAAAKALGEIRTEEAKSALMAGVKDSDSRVRRAVYEALGEWREDDEAYGVLAKAWREEKMYYAAGSAALGMGSSRHPKAFETIVKGLDRPAHAGIVTRSGLLGLAALRDPKAIAVIREYTKPGQPAFVRLSAGIALGRIGDVLEEKRTEIRDILEPLLRDDDFRTRIGVMQGLAAMGDPKAIPELRKAQTEDPLGSIRRLARRTIRQIQEKVAERAKKVEQQEELDKLKDENKDLKARVAKIESQVERLLTKRK